MAKDTEDFWNLFPGVILGAEEAEHEDDPDEGEDEDEDLDEDSEEDEDEPKGPTQEDFDKLQKALKAERRNNRRLDRENKRLASKNEPATEPKPEDKPTDESAKNRELEAVSRAEKLSAGILARDINDAIRKAATKLNFLDPEDAVAGVDRTKIEYDQDDEDPTDIDIDLDTVTAAVKKLASKKPHYLSRGTEDGGSTGSRFGGKKKSKKTEDDALRDMYPGL